MGARPEYERMLADREEFHDKLMAVSILRETVEIHPRLDMNFLRSLGSLPGNPFYEEGE